MIVCEKCNSNFAIVNYTIPEQVAVGKQNQFNFCNECMRLHWSLLKLDYPNSESYLSACFSEPSDHDHMREIDGMS